MKGLSTDVRALACIAGGAGLSVVATLAFAAGPQTPKTATADCAVEVRHTAPQIVVALTTTSEAVVVTPTVRISGHKTCVREVAIVEESVRIHEIRIDAAREVQERVREAHERVRVRIEGLERLERIDFGERELELEESLEIEIEQRLDDAMRQLERLKRLDEEVGT